MSDNNRIGALILLVGSNPLPNYLAAMALKPSKIHLVYSDETEEPMKRLSTALSEDFKSLELTVAIDGDVYVDDPFSASAIGDKIRDLIAKCNGAHLHYTGGTKVMSAHALKVFYERGGQAANASYLDEKHARIRFDDGRSQELSKHGVRLTLNRILQLHGVEQKSRSTVEGGPTPNDVQAIATAVLRRPQLASCLYGERKRLESGTLKEGKEMPLNSNDYGLSLSAAVIPPQDGMKSRCFEAWYKFIGGEWLEEWVAAKVSDIALADNPEIVSGVNCTRSVPAGKFEVDIAAIRGQRSYFISCTTDMTKSMCKSKAFEIMARSRHMGGDLARSALVSLLPNDTVAELRDDIASAWSSSNTTWIFGLEDLRLWLGHNGSPDLGRLKEWLES